MQNNEPWLTYRNLRSSLLRLTRGSFQQSRRNTLSRAKTLAKLHCHIQNKPLSLPARRMANWNLWLWLSWSRVKKLGPTQSAFGIACLNEFTFNRWSSEERIFVWINVNKNQMAITSAYDRFHFFLMYWESRLVFFIGMQDWLSKIYTKMYQLAAGQYALHRNTYTTYVQKWLLLYQGFSAHWVHLPWLLGTFAFSLGYG